MDTKVTQRGQESPLQDVYIVIDPSPRFMCIVGVTASQKEAEAMAEIDDDYRIIQPSGKDYPDSWRFL